MRRCRVVFCGVFMAAWLLAGTIPVMARPLVVGIAEVCSSGTTVSVGAEYLKAVSDGGHLPVVISRYGDDAQLDLLLSRLDLLLLAGGEDVDPARYGMPESPKLGKVNAGRDAFEFRLVAAARKRRLPLVGVCRGCQLLNVAFGGTLWQDLPSEYPAAEPVTHQGVTHPIAIRPGSSLARVLGTTNTVVNSSHHQAVRRLAPGFRVTASAPDGVIEAIESDGYPAIGLQFHPEKLVWKDRKSVFTRLYRNLDRLFTVPVTTEERKGETL